MHINRDVVTDLLPLYLAGEASAGTRALLEQYLREHPEFAAEIRGHAEKSAALLGAAIPPLPPDHEKATFDRVRRVNRTRQWLLACALAGTLLPFSFAFTDEINWILLRDSPRQAAFLALAAVVCWTAYAVMGRRLRAAPSR
jgi:anti-sigma factor RsiW